ncbi:3-oxoacyl-[acyl-carrier-protein] synthase 2 [Desulfosarcina ovata subsp. sediminis]|uniref:3-oxoacyl-[acyl-carrier-protein] synthase 2 n=1 Tax=Desulfosarcina ovata subsp. sediminis TaxID=885957 RepID=A0A5K7ZJQ0_9BACT|nr:beta-ketoacyl-[acyl-carrier-protein] synthase family protein [Desulfosarcina ovata]BBO81614.1 3-oxoacyl-[acyl-carrier-protein] synthase 2 [Desulfosarcina ovata subsp. sediminis]
MRAPLNRKVYIVGYDIATALGSSLDATWQRAVRGEAGFRRVSRCDTSSRSNVVGELPDWDPAALGYFDRKDLYNWNADYVFLTMALCIRALAHAGLEINAETGPRTACLVGSALNGSDALRIAFENYIGKGPLKVSPYLLPNLCANLPAGKAGMQLGFTGPIFSPQGACASGNYAIALGARMIRDGDCDFVLAGGVETCLIPEIIQGFANMWATIKVDPNDRAFNDPTQASRPFSIDRRGIVLAEGGGILVMAAEERMADLGLIPKAEVLGVGWTSDAHHFTLPNRATIVRAIAQAIDDAELTPGDIEYVNAHGTSTAKGDKVEIESLRDVFGSHLARIPVSSNKSQIGHTLGAAGAIEAALGIEAMRRELVLPTVNHIPDPEFANMDLVPNQARRHPHTVFLSNAFGFGGTNCCIVFKGV